MPRTPDELALVLRAMLVEKEVLPDQLKGCAVGSVVPGFTPILTEALRTMSKCQVRVIDATTALPIRIDIDEPHSVGADRILNTLAASRLFKRDCIVVDLGTATTFDCITGDGVFIGGVIAPGLQTSAMTLFRRTAMLSATALVPPKAAIGRRTDEAIRSGVMFGTAEQIEGLVRRIKAEWPRQVAPLVIATGGLGGVVAPLCPSIERVVPELTLVGLRMAWSLAG